MTEIEDDDQMFLERLFLRIASTTTEEQLEKFIKRHLISAITVLSTSNETIRQKGIDLLTHVNKRLKRNPDVQLPVEDLLVQYLDPAHEKFSESFTIMYIKMGYTRLSDDKKCTLLPLLLHALDGKLSSQQDQLLVVCIPVFTHLNHRNQSKWPDLQLGSRHSLRKAVLTFISDVLLVQPASQDEVLAQNQGAVPAGLNRESFEVLKPFSERNYNLDKLKCGLISFLSASSFPFEELALPFIIAMADGSHSVAAAGEMAWKKLFGASSPENKATILSLFQLYMGTMNSKVEVDSRKRQPANIRQQLKLMSIFIKSRTAAACFPQNIQVIFEALFGRVASPSKLKVMAVEFASCVTAACPDNALTTFCPLLFTGIRKLVVEPGMVENAAATRDARFIGTTYSCLGKIGVRCPSLIRNDMALVQQLFDGVATVKSDEVSSGMMECLFLWLPIFRFSAGPWQTILETMVFSYLSNESPKSRLIALKYLEHVFDSKHVHSRWNLLVACGDIKEEIKREALRILHASLEADKLPDFCDLAIILKDKFLQNQMESLNFSVERDSLRQAVWLCYFCLLDAVECDLNHDFNVDYERECPKIVKFWNSVKSSDVRDKWETSLKSYGHLVLKLCEEQPEVDCLVLLSELWHIHPDLIENLPGRRDWLRSLMLSSSNFHMCAVTSELFSHMVSHSEDVDSVLSQLVTDSTASCTNGTSVGLVFAFGHLVARSTCDSDTLTVAKNYLVSKIDTDNPSLTLEAACSVLIEILRCAEGMVFPLSDELIHKLRLLVTSKKEVVKPRLKEFAASALGFFNVTGTLWAEISSALFDVGEGPPQVDLQFYVGEALMNAALGSKSLARRNKWAQNEKDHLKRNEEKLKRTDDDNVKNLLDVILTDKLLSPNRHLRQAALIWLFVLIEKCSWWHPSVVEKLDLCQKAFIDGLAEANDFTQDVASKGLAIVYENGNSEQKQHMVSVLVSSLASGRKAAVPVTSSTKIFEKGLIGKTPSGEALTTYKELCSLATDLNQPELIYKFMRLANHNSIWNSKKGAAFGFSTVMKQAEKELEPYLPQIIPKLYRYQYDPQTKVQTAMRSIWQTLTCSRKDVVDDFLEEILNELMSSLVDKEWRVRESSCLALSDLLSGHSNDAMSKKFPHLWEVLFRVRDDIKESVRVACHRCLTVLQKVTVRFCSSEKGEKASVLIGKVLPVLLNQGIKSKVTEVKASSLQTLILFTKESNISLKPHLVLLVPCLLESLSELEPQILNYLAVRSSGTEQEMLDSARAAAAKTSPMMEALNECVKYVDKECLVAIVPTLCDMLRSGVGLGSRTGTCSFILSLCIQCPREVQAAGCGDKLIRTLGHGLGDRNATIRKQYANTIGHLAKFSSHTATESLLGKLQQEYTNADFNDDRKESAAAFVLRSLAIQDPDLLKEFGSQIAPFVLLATMRKRQKDSGQSLDLQSIWEEIWSELTPGTEGGIRLYKQEIIDYCVDLLRKNPSWTVKADAAKTMRKVANVLGSELSFSEAEALLGALIRSLAGATWIGKEEVLEAIGDTAVECSVVLKNSHQSDKLEECGQILIRECKKSKILYKISAVKCAGRMCSALGVPSLTEIIGVTFPFLLKETNLSESDEESEKKKLDRTVEFQIVAVHALGVAATSSDDEGEVVKVIALLRKQLSGSFWNVQLCSVDSLRNIFEKRPEVLNEGLEGMVLDVIDCFENATQESLKAAVMHFLPALLNEVLKAVQNENYVIADKFFHAVTKLKEDDTAKRNTELMQLIGRLR